MAMPATVSILSPVFRECVRMTDDFHDKMDRAANSSMLAVVARLAMIVTLPLGGFIGAAVYNKLDRTSESTARLEEKVSALLERQIPALNIQIDGRFTSMNERVTRHDRRIDRLEEWRNQRGTP